MRGGDKREDTTNETGLFARIKDSVKDNIKAHFDPLHGSKDSLLFWIEENPRPRDTGTFIIACCGRVLCEVRDLALYGPTPAPVLQQLAAYSGDLRLCAAQRIEFRNVSPWLQDEIRKGLEDLQVKLGAHSRLG